MKLALRLLLGIGLIAALAMPALANTMTFGGNGDTSFGGPIGLGSLTLTDDGTTVSGTVNKGSNGFNDALVLYIQSGPGGFSSTSGVNDNADGLRRAISGLDPSGSNKSLMTFAGGFQPNYAIALGPADDNFGGLFQLASGGGGSLPFISSVNLNPTGNNSSPTYTFSFPVSSIGLTPNSGATFELFGTYLSDTGFRSSEAVAGNDVGAPGWNPYTQTAFGSYTIAPEPSSLMLLSVGAVGLLTVSRRRRFI
jgi:hypothetical protein